jgi:hypothetical protein
MSPERHDRIQRHWEQFAALTAKHPDGAKLRELLWTIVAEITAPTRAARASGGKARTTGYGRGVRPRRAVGEPRRNAGA